ncbi:MAG: GntR family transcriptional regulator [Alphaproteobacteria bacterium]|nr:GntR family transcriptional regulator [Alphaproteobacteria bacterium]
MTLLSEKSEASTLVELALTKLRQDILTGVFAPGSKLRVEELRAGYDIGASPLREALSRLVSNGLVTAEGQKGFRVAPVSMADIRDITNTRKLLEHAALRESLSKGDADWEADVTLAYVRLDQEHKAVQSTSGASVDSWERANKNFHDMLVSACESKWLLNFRQIVYDQAARYRRLVVLDDDQERGAHEEHRQMFEAAIARDTVKSCRLADDHAERTFNLMAVRFGE